MFIANNIIRRGSRRNGDRFPKQRAPKAQGSRAEGGIGGMLPREIYFFFWVIYKNLTDFRKTVETGMDPHLIIAVYKSCVTRCFHYPVLFFHPFFTGLCDVKYALVTLFYASVMEYWPPLLSNVNTSFISISKIYNIQHNTTSLWSCSVVMIHVCASLLWRHLQGTNKQALNRHKNSYFSQYRENTSIWDL